MPKILRNFALAMALAGAIRAAVSQDAAPVVQPQQGVDSQPSCDPMKIRDSLLKQPTDPTIVAFARKLATVYCEAQTKSENFDDDFADLNFLQSFGLNNPVGVQAAAFGVLERQAESTLAAVAQNRPDKQASASATAAGTTQLVTKAGGAELLALALDAGALTKTVNGSTATVSGNLEGIVSTLTGQNPLGDLNDNISLWRKVAGDIDLSATFVLNQQSGKTTTATQPAAGTSPPANTGVVLPSSVGKLSNITAKVTLYNPFDPHSSKFQKNWKTAVAKASGQLTAALTQLAPKTQDFQNKLSKDAAFDNDWNAAQSNLNLAAHSGTPEAFATAFAKYYGAEMAEAVKFDSSFDSEVTQIMELQANVINVRRQILDDARGNMGSIQYSFNKPEKQPQTHDITYIFGCSPCGNNPLWNAATGNMPLLSANADISIYGGTIPSGAKYGRLHYGQASAEFDRPLAPPGKMNSTIFTLAAYGQYQPDPSVLNITPGDVAPGTTIDAPTQVLVGTKGMLFVAQAKLAVKSKGGISVPFGVKWSNKTDLLGSNKLGAQIGISYDFSSLSSLFGGSTAQQ